MADMVHPFIYETASAPGTSATFNLAGTVTGRRTFASAFSTGAAVYYFMDDGTQAEWGSGVFTSGSPNTLTRTTVIGNTAGTTSRLNFTGTTRVYCDYPGERIVFQDASQNVRLPGTLTVDGALTQTGAATLSSTAHIVGAVTADAAVSVGTTLTVASVLLAAYLRGYIDGLTLSRSSATAIGISAGVATDSTFATTIRLASAFTKSTAGAWSAGTGNNGMGTALTIANSTWYHVFAIINAGAADVYFDTSATAANKPTSTTYFRRIGSFLTNGSAQIVDFSQYGDEFLWKVAVQDVADTGLGSTSTNYPLTVPLGIKVRAKFRAIATLNATGDVVLIQSPDETTQVANTPAGNGQLTSTATHADAVQMEIRTDTSKQIKAVSNGFPTALYIVTYGWIDPRGRE